MEKPRQKRAIETREKILTAVEALLADHEFEDISIAQIAKTAGVAVGSVYSHFEDKSALLPALLDRSLGAAKARIDELREHGTVAGFNVSDQAGMDLRTTIEAALRAGLAQVTQTIGTRRALLTYRRMNPDLEVPLAEALQREAFELFLSQLDAYRDEIKRADLRKAATMVNYFINLAFLDKGVFRKPLLPEELVPDDEAKIEAFTTMLYAYLAGEDGQN